MKQWLRTACEPTVRRCATKYALVVGPVLVVINHGDAILTGQVNGSAMVKIALTMLVPYVVSTCSSVGTICRMRAASAETNRDKERP